ncbi:MAG: DNA-protecting protein DprA [Parachlamydiaceae bacterium]|nr:DNA-protecting protein DprA [Parachlamydiaceae bacterium]
MNNTIAKECINHPLKGVIYANELEELEALVILSSIESIGSVKIRQLLQVFGSALLALLADPSEIASLPGFGQKIVAQWTLWKSDSRWRNNLVLADKEKVQIVPITSAVYPKKLLELVDPPIILYVKGDISLIKSKCIAIVGTRQASIYGNETAKKFAKELAGMGYVILSGLARGIDTSAHIGALESGTTAAVIGSGLADIYPAENRFLADKICKEGCLISEFPMATPPDRQNFPQRNRIVSALSLGVVLIEAPIKSGAMITMNNGRAMGKKLFVLPGRIDGNFGGNHSLLKSGLAQLVESSEEIAHSFDDLFSGGQKAVAPLKLRIPLDKEEGELLQLLPTEEMAIEEIVQRTKLPISVLNVLLMSLVLKGAIKEFPGKVYKKQVSNG